MAYITPKPRPAFTLTTEGPICSLLSSALGSATCCVIAITTFIDEYGAHMLRSLYPKGLPCAKLVVDEKEYKKKRKLLQGIEKSGWKTIAASFKTHSKIYIAITPQDDLLKIVVARGSANLTQREILCISMNNLTLEHYLVDRDGLRALLDNILASQLYENVYQVFIEEALDKCKS